MREDTAKTSPILFAGEKRMGAPVCASVVFVHGFPFLDKRVDRLGKVF